jgi:hypothetical protein
MTDTVAVGPDQRALGDHLQSARFQAGVDAGRWRLVSMTWPHALIAISAAPREGAPDEFVLKFELTGYPTSAPTGCPWDLNGDVILEAGKRPKGTRVGHIFRPDWEQGRALYAPWDRLGQGHGDWATRHPMYVWNARRDLTFYLTNVHDALNSDDYLGV